MTDRNRQQIWFNYRFHPFPLRQQFAELLGGYIAGSLAIMSDAAHLLSDCISFIVALVAICLSKKSPDNYMTFGYKRVGKCVAYRHRKRLKWMFFFFHSICDLFSGYRFLHWQRYLGPSYPYWEFGFWLRSYFTLLWIVCCIRTLTLMPIQWLSFRW